jgi:copper transporter 1
MVWNWRVVDSCFLASSWHVTNNAMFAASCIGTMFLVVCLEFLRRVGHEYDALLLRQFQRQLRLQQAALASAMPSNCCDGPVATLGTQFATFRATGLQQLIRAVLHAATLGVAYLVMLIVMSYNGYVFISVLLGAVLGKFLCDWLVVRIPYQQVGDEKDVRKSSIGASGPTGCCA